MSVGKRRADRSLLECVVFWAAAGSLFRPKSDLGDFLVLVSGDIGCRISFFGVVSDQHSTVYCIRGKVNWALAAMSTEWQR